MKNLDSYFIEIARQTAKLSTCVKMKVGAVLVKDDRIVSVGYNGTPSGYANCSDEFSAGTFTKESHHVWSIQHEIHAEMNAILFAAKTGIPTDACTLYITHEPCDNCLKNIIAAGIKRIVYVEPHRDGHHDELFCGDYRNSGLARIEKFNG